MIFNVVVLIIERNGTDCNAHTNISTKHSCIIFSDESSSPINKSEFHILFSFIFYYILDI